MNKQINKPIRTSIVTGEVEPEIINVDPEDAPYMLFLHDFGGNGRLLPCTEFVK